MNRSGGSRQAKAPTLADVAQAAGVSVSTAARVLRNAPYPYPVDANLSKAVRKAAEKLNYVPNVVARSLRSGGPKMIGLVVGDMLDPYYGEIAEATTLHAESVRSLGAIVSNMQRDPLLELKHCQRLWEQRVAGLILAGGGFDQWSHLDALTSLVRQITEAGIIVVTQTPRGIGTPTFCVDNELVGSMMVEHLVSMGHRRIGVLLGPPQSEVTQQRMRGATRALTAAGAGFQVLHADYSPEAGGRAIATLLERQPTLTAFVVGSNAMALGAVAWLKQTGRMVPDDISVIGVGTPQTAAWITPQLTLVDANLGNCARAAVNYIAARVSGEMDPMVPTFTPTLFTGGSVRQI